MAIGDYAVGKVTPAAFEINRDAWIKGAPMPQISYFIPAYIKEAIVLDNKGRSWMKTPWFWELDPVMQESTERHYHDMKALKITSIDEISHIPGVLKYKGNLDDSEEKGLYCEIGKVSRVSGEGEQSVMLKVVLEKETGTPKDKHITSGTEANVFYIIDSSLNIIAVLHAYGFTFDRSDKWEIIQHLAYQYNAPIKEVKEDDNPFELKSAMEALMPEIIVGDPDDARKSNKAKYDFHSFLEEKPDCGDKRVFFLETVKNIPVSVPDAAIIGDNIRFDMENPNARLDLNGQELTIGGDSPRGCLNITNSSGGGKLVVAGNNASLEIMSHDADGDVNNDAVNFRGTGICVVNGQLNSRGNIHNEGIISQNLDIESLKVKSVRVNNDQVIEDGEIIAGKLKFKDSRANITNDDDNLKLNDNLTIDDKGCVRAEKVDINSNLTIGTSENEGNAIINGILAAGDIKLGDLFLKFLLPGVIVGSEEDKSEGRATHTLAALNSLDLSGKRVLFLETVEPLTSDLEISGDDIRFDMESPTAEIKNPRPKDGVLR